MQKPGRIQLQALAPVPHEKKLQTQAFTGLYRPNAAVSRASARVFN
jgi:hypothetical protein